MNISIVQEKKRKSQSTLLSLMWIFQPIPARLQMLGTRFNALRTFDIWVSTNTAVQSFSHSKESNSNKV